MAGVSHGSSDRFGFHVGAERLFTGQSEEEKWKFELLVPLLCRFHCSLSPEPQRARAVNDRRRRWCVYAYVR